MGTFFPRWFSDLCVLGLIFPYNFITFKVPVVFFYGGMGHTPCNIYIDEKDVKVSFKNSLKSVTCSPPKCIFEICSKIKSKMVQASKLQPTDG